MTTDPEAFNDYLEPTVFPSEYSGAAAFPSVMGHKEGQRLRQSAVDAEPSHLLQELKRQVQSLTQQLEEERHLNERLLTMQAFNHDLVDTPNQERAARKMAGRLANTFACGLVCIFEIHPEDGHFKLLACAGALAGQVPVSFLSDSNQPAIDLAIQKQHLLSSQDISEACPPLQLGSLHLPSFLAAPLVQQGRPRGLILLADPADNRFHPGDFPLVEAAVEQLLAAWAYAWKNEVLTDFVQSISMLSVVQEAPSLLEMTASIARITLKASYVLVASLNQQVWLIRAAGHAPRLLSSFQNGAKAFLETASKSPYTFRLRDLRQDERAAILPIDSPELCSLLACPIRINGASSGVLLAFGKTDQDAFTDNDVFLAELLVSQATVNLESCLLNQELRGNLKTTQLLYDLSQSISNADNLKDAVRAIARTAYRLFQARKCGLLLFSTDGRTEAEVRFPVDDPSLTHPHAIIQQAMDSRQTIYLADDSNLSCIAIPIQTSRRCFGALWMEISEESDESRHPTEEIRILVNQAAVALERAILLEETRQQASEISRSYNRLENAYEGLLYGLTKALDARDGETNDHSWRVEGLAVRLGAELGLSRSELQSLKRGALLHDIGKIGVPDSILRKRGKLNEEEWNEMRQHPQKGADIIQDIPALHDALPVIAFHQERWDGSGYPMHLTGTNIPLLARIFAVVDVYDALTTDRPYRSAISQEETLAYIESQAGIQFDPEIVARFILIIRAGQDVPTSPGSEPNS